MAEVTINDLLPEVPYDPPKLDMKRQKYLGKAYTEEQINKLSAEEVDKLFSNYEAKFSRSDGEVLRQISY